MTETSDSKSSAASAPKRRVCGPDRDLAVCLDLLVEVVQRAKNDRGHRIGCQHRTRLRVAASLRRLGPAGGDQRPHAGQRHAAIFLDEEAHHDRVMEAAGVEVVAPQPALLLHSEIFLPLEHQRIVADDAAVDAEQLQLVEGQLIEQLHRFDGGRHAVRSLLVADEKTRRLGAAIDLVDGEQRQHPDGMARFQRDDEVAFAARARGDPLRLRLAGLGAAVEEDRAGAEAQRRVIAASATVSGRRSTNSPCRIRFSFIVPRSSAAPRPCRRDRRRRSRPQAVPKCRSFFRHSAGARLSRERSK